MLFIVHLLHIQYIYNIIIFLMVDRNGTTIKDLESIMMDADMQIPPGGKTEWLQNVHTGKVVKDGKGDAKRRRTGKGRAAITTNARG